MKCFADTCAKRSEILAKQFAGLRPLISRKSGRKKLHEKSSTFSTRDETKFFHSKILGVVGPNLFGWVFFVRWVSLHDSANDKKITRLDV